MTSVASVSVGEAPVLRKPADAALYLMDWLSVTVPDAAERASCLRQFADAIWTGTAQVVERLEEYAAELDSDEPEPEPCEYPLSDIDGYERVGSGIFTPAEWDEAWLEQEVARA